MTQRSRGHPPIIHPIAWLAANATLVGYVMVEAAFSIWYGTTLQGDESSIHVGVGSNIQDNAVLHCGVDCPTVIDRDTTVGYGAVLRSCTVENTCLIGMGTVLLNGYTIDAGNLAATEALVIQGVVIPPNSLMVGSPARVVRSFRPEEATELLQSAKTHRTLSAELPPTAGASKTGGNV